jgi:hypothetical protein
MNELEKDKSVDKAIEKIIKTMVSEELFEFKFISPLAQAQYFKAWTSSNSVFEEILSSDEIVQELTRHAVSMLEINEI